MMDRLHHRGPDDAGEYIESGVALGFRRLAILDLTSAGHQPMANEDKTVWAVFNGEIYNFLTLREELAQRGHRFLSRTDSEVLVHGYEEYGDAVVERLDGMFSFAIWDQRKQRLLAARDRFGKKPFFYSEQNGSLFFASEISALRPVLQKTTIDPSVLALYFRLQFIPSPRTIYQNIRKLPPAHRLVWHAGRTRIERYWSLPVVEQPQSAVEAGKRFVQLLRAAVTKRLMSDVPLGVFLSGGFDSSVITALMAESSAKAVKTFSIGFPEASHNELGLARLVAQRYSTDHTEATVRPDVVATLPKLLHHYGEPFADSSAIAVYAVAQETRKHVTVALTGDGGDENLAGYTKYQLLNQLQHLDHIPAALRGLMGAGVMRLAGMLPVAIRKKAVVAGSLLSGTIISRYLDSFFVFTNAQLSELLSTDILKTTLRAETIAAERLADAPVGETVFQRLTALDTRLYLPEGLMTKTDIATMAVSLEARSPFLDHDLMEFTAALPDRYKRRGSLGKWLLRESFGALLPPEVLCAPKHGFDLPVNQWLRGPLAAFAQERLTDPTMRDLSYFNHRFVDRLLAEHTTNQANHGIRLWALLCFAVWYQDVYQSS